MGAGLGVSEEATGVVVGGSEVRRWAFGDEEGLFAQVLGYGATLQALWVPAAGGERANVVLGFRDAAQYLSPGVPYFGATIGRYANRIAGGRFRLDGATFEVPANDRGNALHGGTAGFDTRVWAGEEIAGDGDTVGVRLRYTSPDTEMGFPGNLESTVSYLTDGRSLRIEYRATTDAATVVNLTNHSYFNLAGEGAGSVEDHLLWIDAAEYLPIDATAIPLGPAAPVAGTPFDFSRPHAIGETMGSDDGQLALARGYDHNWVLRPATVPGPGGIRKVASLSEASSGRRMEVWTDQPGMQFYGGNLLDGALVGYSGRPYGRFGGLALETQHFPDSPNRQDYPSTLLRPGQRYTSSTMYTFSAGPGAG